MDRSLTGRLGLSHGGRSHDPLEMVGVADSSCEWRCTEERNTRGAMLRGPAGIAIQLPNGKRQVDDGSSELVHVQAQALEAAGLVSPSIARPTFRSGSDCPRQMSIRRYVRTARCFDSGTATPVTPVTFAQQPDAGGLPCTMLRHRVEREPQSQSTRLGFKLQTLSPVLGGRGSFRFIVGTSGPRRVRRGRRPSLMLSKPQLLPLRLCC
jgi:hypothetical protein